MGDYLYFISHSARDRDLAVIFYNYLNDAIGIPENQIFCASVTENIPFGTDDYLQYIRRAIIDTKSSGGAVIALITPDFMKSDFCKYEIGAAWIKEIPIRPFFFPPVQFCDKEIQASPLSKTQAVIYDPENQEKSANNMLAALILDGEKSEVIRNYISAVSNGRRAMTTQEAASMIVNYIRRLKIENAHFDILKATCGSYHAQGFSHTMTAEKDIENQYVEMSVDFRSGVPPYVGYYVRPLRPSNWEPYVDEKFSLRFDALASEEVKGIIVEVNCNDYQIFNKFCRFRTSSWMTYNIYLGNMDAKDGWSSMKEICFVLNDKCLGEEKGTVLLRNLRLERDPR